MLVLAIGTFATTEKVAPFLPAEVAMVHKLRDEGIVLTAYRVANRPSALLTLQVKSVADARERFEQLPLFKAGLVSFEFAELVPF
jgi:hypothetical protein